MSINELLFQFTRPAWGATRKRVQRPQVEGVSIHAPRVGRDPVRTNRSRQMQVSIHAPRVGRDRVGDNGLIEFQVSIHAPRVGRDHRSPTPARSMQVSIHAPRVGRDIQFLLSLLRIHSFNSRAPRGARHASHIFRRAAVVFQFTRPAWGATCVTFAAVAA